MRVLKDYEINDAQVFVFSIDSAAHITKAVKNFIDDLNRNVIKALEDSEVDFELEIDSEISERQSESLVHALTDWEEPPAIDAIPDKLKEFSYKVNCVAHKLQLAVNSFIWKNPEVKRLIDQALILTTKLRMPIVKLKLDANNIKQANMPQLTRWNLVPLMMKRVLELEDFCRRLQYDTDFKDLKLSDETWEQFKELSAVLNLAETLTLQLQAEDLLVPDFIYFWYRMKLKLLCMSSEYAKKLLICVENYEGDLKKNDIVLAGWFLDKNVGRMLKDPEKIEKGKNVIRMLNIKRKLITGNVIKEIDDVSVLADDIEIDPLSNIFLERYLDGESSAPSSSQGRSGLGLEMEIKKYEKMKAPEQRTNVISWWLQNEEEFPIISPLALAIVSAPLTEVTGERLSSHLEIVLTKHRSKLNGDLLNSIMFLRLNTYLVKNSDV